MEQNTLQVFKNKLKIISQDELKVMTKIQLIDYIIIRHQAYGNLREYYLNKCIECDFLKRENELLESKVFVLNKPNFHHSFTNIDKSKKITKSPKRRGV